MVSSDDVARSMWVWPWRNDLAECMGCLPLVKRNALMDLVQHLLGADGEGRLDEQTDAGAQEGQQRKDEADEHLQMVLPQFTVQWTLQGQQRQILLRNERTSGMIWPQQACLQENGMTSRVTVFPRPSASASTACKIQAAFAVDSPADGSCAQRASS